MGFIELFFIALGLAMDAFAAAICKGLGMRLATPKKMLLVGAYFGVFQAGMPLLGYLIGVRFSDAIRSVDHWIAFGLLCVIGINMVREAVKEKNECPRDCCAGAGAGADLSFKNMSVLAVATSIDALAVGVGFAFLDVPILPAAAVIGVVTLLLSMAGVKIGSLFGCKLKSKAEIFGGIILILMGTKILLEHLGVISW